jgi:hypothetical protein
MRGFLLLIIAGLVIAAGCLGPEQPTNETNITNDTNVTPPEPVCTGPVCGSDGVTYDTDCIAQYANVSVIHEGVCVENCTDSDGGSQPDETGTVTKGEDTFYDYCIDEQQLAEYICLDNSQELVTINCGEGKECFRDRCVKKPEPEPNITLECVGPSEADVLVNESVSYNSTVYSDYCIEFDVVKDYFCKDNKPEAINNECPDGYGCQSGRCEKQYMKCTDSDGGNDTSKRGRIIVTKGLGTYVDEWDYCTDAVQLREYYCAEDNTSASQEIDCGSGSKCFEDRCVESKCSETDGGLNIYKKGTITAGEEEFTDECVNYEELHEYYCYGDEIRLKVTDCGPGYICNVDSSRCVEGEVSD